jgi:hypothetical protein
MQKIERLKRKTAHYSWVFCSAQTS